MRTTLTIAATFALALFGMSSSAHADTYWSTGNNGSSLIKFDTITGATTFIGNFTSGVTYGLAFGPDGTAYTLRSSNSTLATVNLSTGALTTIGGPGGFFGYALDFANDGNLYAINVSTNQIFGVNTSTGAFTFLRNLTGPATGVMDMTFDKNGNLWVVGPGDNRIYSVNLATGASSLAFTTALGSLMGIAADSNGDLIATSHNNTSQFERINTTTGASVIVGTIGAGNTYAHGGDIVLTAVPEPTSLLLLGSGLVYGVRRRLRRTAA